MKQTITLLLCVFILSLSAQQQRLAEAIFYNGKVYTVDSVNTVVSAFAVMDGRIAKTGTDDDIKKNFRSPNQIDLKGKAVYPGFIDAHCHFYGYGQTKQQVDLTGTKSFDEVIERVVAFSKTNPEGWLTGRGGDQNDWEVKQFPDNRKLDELFPNRPVLLKRIDGHAALANTVALKLAGITSPKNIEGGVFMSNNGTLTGILIDNAVDSVSSKIPEPNRAQIISSLLTAQKDCFAVGLTTVSDAGLERKIVDIIHTLNQEKKLKMRMYVMLTSSTKNFDHFLKTGPYKTPFLNVRSFKFYADGALGSRGACLLAPYTDQPQKTGFLLNDEEFFRKYAQIMYDGGWQMNTHCIGDSATRVMLDIYASVLKQKNDRRWRIEHAQVVEPSDLKKFSDYSIIPSVQPTHATSDMYWADERLGPVRIKNAYSYKDLMKCNGWLASGSDFPVESINPLFGFYAAVARKDHKGYPDKGFQTENAITREEALKAMTIWAAKSNFEENEKGSLTQGKHADFVILDKDIMTVPITEVINTKVLSTYVAGEKVYGNEK